MNPVAREPVVVGVLAAVLTWVGARYGVRVDPQQASEAAGVVLLVAAPFVRQLVRPVARDLGRPVPDRNRPEPPGGPEQNR